MKRRAIIGLLALATLIGGLLYLIGPNAADPVDARRAHAMAGMVTGLLAIWVWGGGGVMWWFRAAVVARVRAIPLKWQVKFVLFCTLLAGLEEAVTVGMTNLAPVFGSKIGEAYITASTNWLDVVMFHSVVVLVPFFIALALLLTRWAFSPFAVFLGFGVVGTVAEAIFAGNPGMMLAFPLWVFVYGLMVWLPACSLLPDRGGASGRAWAEPDAAGHDHCAGDAACPAGGLCHRGGAGPSVDRLCALRVRTWRRAGCSTIPCHRSCRWPAWRGASPRLATASASPATCRPDGA